MLLLLAANECSTDEEVWRLCNKLGHFVLFPAQVPLCAAAPPTQASTCPVFCVPATSGRATTRYPGWAEGEGLESRHLESRPRASARLDIEVSAGWVSPSSRGLWRGDALLPG